MATQRQSIIPAKAAAAGLSREIVVFIIVTSGLWHNSELSNKNPQKLTFFSVRIEWTEDFSSLETLFLIYT